MFTLKTVVQSVEETSDCAAFESLTRRGGECVVGCLRSTKAKDLLNELLLRTHVHRGNERR